MRKAVGSLFQSRDGSSRSRNAVLFGSAGTLCRRAGAVIGAGNFFELALATLISLFGFNSDAALAE